MRIKSRHQKETVAKRRRKRVPFRIEPDRYVCVLAQSHRVRRDVHRRNSTDISTLQHIHVHQDAIELRDHLRHACFTNANACQEREAPQIVR